MTGRVLDLEGHMAPREHRRSAGHDAPDDPGRVGGQVGDGAAGEMIARPLVGPEDEVAFDRLARSMCIASTSRSGQGRPEPVEDRAGSMRGDRATGA